MIVRDWRDADPSDTQVLYAREQEYWVRELAWDASTAWREIEQARVTWGLPGFIAIDNEPSAVRGWAYFLPEGETAHLGGVVADTREATNALLDACLESALRPPRPARVSCSCPFARRGSSRLFTSVGSSASTTDTCASPSPTGEDAAQAEPWTPGDVLPAADLLRASYGLEGPHFAPRGTPEEWEQYVRSLAERPGCGVIEPTVTRVVRNGTSLQALVLATRIAPGTLHLPQVAVHPSRRREGLAERLVSDACRAAASRGVKQATLLVADSNTAARALYEKMGFAATSAFIAGTKTV